ncbi:hypothetical protein [Agrococcus sediminis]|uniref:hypothetical protein n=1 Tax=Agrococcus sediminis TaxID=2599924 RepID=UPI0034205E6B
MGSTVRASTAAPRMRRGRPARALAAAALIGVAALLAACTAQPAAPSGSPSAPDAPPSATGAAPVPIEDDRLNDSYLFDRVSSEGVVVAWAEPGETLAVIIGGSGGGGGCIPQPQPLELDEAEPAATIRFDPPDPAMMCTADFRLHGWELALPSAIELDRVLQVSLVNLQGNDEVLELQVGPDDRLESGPTADPQPSLIPGSGEAANPAPIADDEMPALDALPTAGGSVPVQAAWVEPGRTLAVFLTSSGSTACVPEPVAAESRGPGTIAVEFRFPEVGEDTACTADAVPYGWIFTLPEQVPAGLGVEVTVTGVSPDGGDAVVELSQEDVVELG